MTRFQFICFDLPRCAVLLLALVALSLGHANGQLAHGQSLGELTPVVVQPIQAERAPATEQAIENASDDDAIAPSGYRSSEPPVSISGDNELLTLATDGIAVLPGLPSRPGGCSVRPTVRCTGPNYRGCTPRVYYGTNPCDDDPILPLVPAINDPKTSHWYDHALRMILRKKHVAEAMH